MIKKNVGKTDSIIRILIAVVIAILLFTGQVNGALAIVLGVLGIVLLLTGFLSFCLVYALFGISTCKKGTEAPK